MGGTREADETDGVLYAVYVEMEVVVQCVCKEGVMRTIVHDGEEGGAHAVALREGVDDVGGGVVAEVDVLVGVGVVGLAGEEVVWGDGVGRRG